MAGLNAVGIFISAMSRVVLALLMSVGVVTHVYLKVNSPKPKWVIYMTNQVGIHFKSIVKIFPGNCLAGSPLHPTCLAGPLCKVQVVVAVFFPSREYSRRSKSDGSTLPFLYKLSWGLEVKVKASLDVQYFLRTWCLPFLSSSLFSTGLCCILILWSTVGWRFGFSPTELMKVPLHAFLDTTGRVHELLCACPQYGDT